MMLDEFREGVGNPLVTNEQFKSVENLYNVLPEVFQKRQMYDLYNALGCDKLMNLSSFVVELKADADYYRELSDKWTAEALSCQTAIYKLLGVVEALKTHRNIDVFEIYGDIEAEAQRARAVDSLNAILKKYEDEQEFELSE